MELTEQFRRNAEDALNQAREAKNMAVRREWLNIVGQWTALAKARMEVTGIQAPHKASEHPRERH